MPRTLKEHLDNKGPRRILALDGGGVRGVVTLEFLADIEDLLRPRSPDPTRFVLSDYFDLIGGTSTGSILAAGLATGMTVQDLRTLYHNLAGKIFHRPFGRIPYVAPKFPARPLRQALHDTFKETALGDAEILTGLMIMTKRLDTGSPWPLTNNPAGRYYDRRPGSKGTPNRDFKLKSIVRASTAAPSYFEPERITVAEVVGEEIVEGAFVDGGMSTANNPALQLFQVATLSGFKLEWATGPDDLLLVSVGTGSMEVRHSSDEIMEDWTAVEHAMHSLMSMMHDSDALVQTMMQWMSKTPTPWRIDSEIGNLSQDLLGGRELLSYLRYNICLDQEWLKAELGEDVSAGELKKLREMDEAGSVAPLAELGAAAAARQVRSAHFPKQFDTP